MTVCGNEWTRETYLSGRGMGHVELEPEEGSETGAGVRQGVAPARRLEPHGVAPAPQPEPQGGAPAPWLETLSAAPAPRLEPRGVAPAPRLEPHCGAPSIPTEASCPSQYNASLSILTPFSRYFLCEIQGGGARGRRKKTNRDRLLLWVSEVTMKPVHTTPGIYSFARAVAVMCSVSDVCSSSSLRIKHLSFSFREEMTKTYDLF